MPQNNLSSFLGPISLCVPALNMLPELVSRKMVDNTPGGSKFWGASQPIDSPQTLPYNTPTPSPLRLLTILLYSLFMTTISFVGYLLI